MHRYVCVTFGILVSVSALTSATEFNSRQAYIMNTEKCMKEFNINYAEFKQAKMDKKVDKLDACFLACLFKAKLLLDENGMFSMKQAYENAEKYVKNPDALEKMKKVGEICSAVNEKQVSDGKKGCERALLIWKCIEENKSEAL